MANGNLTLVLNPSDYAKLASKLEKLEYVDRTAAVKNGLTKGMAPIVAEGKSNLQSRNNRKTGKLAGSFSTQLRAANGQYIKAGFKRPAGASSHLVDRGTKERWTKSGKYTGSVSKGNPNHGSMFWTDAVNARGNDALEILLDEVNKEIERIFNG